MRVWGILLMAVAALHGAMAVDKCQTVRSADGGHYTTVRIVWMCILYMCCVCVCAVLLF